MAVPTFDGAVAGRAEPKPKPWAMEELLVPEDIVLDAEAASKPEVLRCLAGMLSSRAGGTKDSMLAALLRRERLGPTYIGGGMAIPHGRHGRSLLPAAAVLRLRQPVEYATTDDDVADMFMALVWPESVPSGFVPALASMCRLLRDPPVVRAIKKATTAEELHSAITAGERMR